MTTKLNTREEGSSNDGKKKDMEKVKCFTCHKTVHYANQCPSRNKGKGKTQVVALAKVKEFAARFEKEFSLASCLFGTSVRGA